MPADLNRLCWLDMEMSGLVPDSDRVLEIALLVTDSDLNHLSEGKVLVVHQPGSVLDSMDSWNKSVHGKSGLIERVRASDLDEAKAEAAALKFLTQFVVRGQLAALRQFDLPGPPVPRALDAAARSVLPLPQSRRLDGEGSWSGAGSPRR
jgi:oligoribonuclease (3'-5' exoribonuclease)